jgi:hypothetical protein
MPLATKTLFEKRVLDSQKLFIHGQPVLRGLNSSYLIGIVSICLDFSALVPFFARTLMGKIKNAVKTAVLFIVRPQSGIIVSPDV